MKEFDNAIAFAENEKEANKYTARCLRILACVVACVWLLNILNIFIVPQLIMALSAAGSIVLFLIPTVLYKLFKDSKYLKVYIMACCVLGITLLGAAMPKHAIVAWAAPLVLSCHYYSKRYTYATLAASVICMIASLVIGTHYGEWDANILGISEKAANSIRVVDGDVYYRLFLFIVLPRAMILVGISTVCSTLAKRTHILLERQIESNLEKQQIESELNVATHIQSSMLPCIFPAFPERKEFDIYATMNPAKEVGGDFYDFFMVDESHLAIVMADVSGKGVPAALFMVIGKTLVKDHTQPDKDLGEVFSEVNKLLCESNSEGLFITAFEGVLDLKTGRFVFVNAGHEMPFICKSSEGFEPYKIHPGFVLAGMDETRYRQGEIMLDEGDMIFQYTDGVTEATDINKQLYGMERLQKILNKAKGFTPSEILTEVKKDIDSFVGEAPQFDDITMLCLHYKKRMEE